MGYVDIFDKMIQNYWRSTNDVSDEHAYTAFFIHACIHQAFIASNYTFGMSRLDRNQLQFRIELLQRIKEKLINKNKKTEENHQPIEHNFKKITRKTCQFSRCRSSTRFNCRGCNNSYSCLKHMHHIHCNLLNKLQKKMILFFRL